MIGVVDDLEEDKKDPETILEKNFLQDIIVTVLPSHNPGKCQSIAQSAYFVFKLK